MQWTCYQNMAASILGEYSLLSLISSPFIILFSTAYKKMSSMTNSFLFYISHHCWVPVPLFHSLLESGAYPRPEWYALFLEKFDSWFMTSSRPSWIISTGDAISGATSSGTVGCDILFNLFFWNNWLLFNTLTCLLIFHVVLQK